MVKISIIIVNYNVRYFIEQAIVSILKASTNIDTEIIVVDNASSDASVEMIQSKFPEVQLIANKKNIGFGRANNQGIKLAKGDYILLLNPDTVLQENTLSTCIAFMEEKNDCGAIGVKMIDGKGNFLPESKRGLPLPSVAFYKMSGLASLFPTSKTFGKYHLGYLDQNENHEVDVLSGAFMFFRADLLQEIGGFDEDYFMYGEDIDLSYQVLKRNYKNYYLADTSIIHYKGESTKKGSLNYVKVFYEAMLIFAKKHFSPKQAKIYSVAIYFAIFLKGLLTILQNISRNLLLPIVDFAFAGGALITVTKIWAIQVKNNPSYYPDKFFLIVIPIYLISWLVSTAFTGGYEKPFRISKIWKGIFFGTILIAAIYGLLPDSLRFSRAILLLGAFSTGTIMLLTRLLFNFFSYKQFTLEMTPESKVVIIGNEEEANRALSLLKESDISMDFVGFIGYQKDVNRANYIGEHKNIKDIVSAYDIQELIFCGKDISSIDIISTMSELGNALNYKILPEESLSIIGSNSKNSAGDLYAIDVNLKINTKRARILKRLFDLALSLLLLISLPLNILFITSKGQYLSNIFMVILGKLSWVGYAKEEENVRKYTLPKIRNGVLNPSLIYENKKGLTFNKLNLLYAKNYTVEQDAIIFFKCFSKLGNSIV